MNESNVHFVTSQTPDRVEYWFSRWHDKVLSSYNSDHHQKTSKVFPRLPKAEKLSNDANYRAVSKACIIFAETTHARNTERALDSDPDIYSDQLME